VLVLDSDDDLTEDYRLVSGRGEEFRQVLREVDYVTVSTSPLANHFAQYTRKPPVILHNCIDSEWMTTVADKGKRLIEELTIGFSGSPTHWGDWYLPAVPFARIGRDFPEITLLLHGSCPRYLSLAAEKTSLVRLGDVPFVIYPVLLSQFDIVLCAVDVRDEFNAGKSAIKALECMALGVVPICSRFGPYLDLEAAGAPVVVVEEESRDGWYEAMRSIIRYEDRRKWLKGKGPVWVRERRDMATGYRQWADFFLSCSY
jgi:glycosyltransferase involved in cell wall biosynthesis